MPPELVRWTTQFLPNFKLVQVYVLSETGFLTGLQDHEHNEDKLMSCGRGTDILVVDESGREVETGQTGELVTRGANVMRGYWNKPQETNLAFRDGMFRTGSDRVFRRPQLHERLDARK
jgi:acyl-CoA synthetase (AMP-forming)/AMP-acid ligase II